MTTKMSWKNSWKTHLSVFSSATWGRKIKKMRNALRNFSKTIKSRKRMLQAMRMTKALERWKRKASRISLRRITPTTRTSRINTSCLRSSRQRTRHKCSDIPSSSQTSSHCGCPTRIDWKKYHFVSSVDTNWASRSNLCQCFSTTNRF